LAWPEAALGNRDRPSEQRDAVVILAHFLELLALLIGEDLTLRVVRDIWRDLPDGSQQEMRNDQT
jgi:hypothetical protein